MYSEGNSDSLMHAEMPALDLGGYSDWMAAFSGTSPRTDSSHEIEIVKAKPGRKVLNDAPKSKRTAQNRASQRAFRERKDTEKRSLEEENLQLKRTINALQLENSFLKATPEHSVKGNTAALTFASVGGSDLSMHLDSQPITTSSTPFTSAPFDTHILNSFGTQYRAEEGNIEPYSNSMDELFDILNIPLPFEENKSTSTLFPDINIEELCDMFKMKAKCDKVKDTKEKIRTAWGRGDREEVFHLVGHMQTQIEEVDLKLS